MKAARAATSRKPRTPRRNNTMGNWFGPVEKKQVFTFPNNSKGNYTGQVLYGDFIRKTSDGGSISTGRTLYDARIKRGLDAIDSLFGLWADKDTSEFDRE